MHSRLHLARMEDCREERADRADLILSSLPNHSTELPVVAMLWPSADLQLRIIMQKKKPCQGIPEFSKMNG